MTDPPTPTPGSDLDSAIKTLLDSGAIESCVFRENQFLSSYFLVDKPDGSKRFTLNLKEFNLFLFREHFKIEDLRTAINLLSRGDFLCRLDLQDAY